MNPLSAAGHSTGDAQTLSFLNFNTDQLGSAIKASAQDLSTAKKQAKMANTPIASYLTNRYASSEYAFLYDFYQEKDSEHLKLFIESLYTHIQRTLSETCAMQPTKDPAVLLSLQKEFAGMLRLLMKTHQSLRSYYQTSEDILASCSTDLGTQEQFSRYRTEGKKVLCKFYRVFVMLDTCVGFLKKIESSSSTKSVNMCDNSTQTSKDHQNEAPESVPLFYSNDTFEQDTQRAEGKQLEAIARHSATTRTEINETCLSSEFDTIM